MERNVQWRKPEPAPLQARSQHKVELNILVAKDGNSGKFVTYAVFSRRFKKGAATKAEAALQNWNGIGLVGPSITEVQPTIHARSMHRRANIVVFEPSVIPIAAVKGPAIVLNQQRVLRMDVIIQAVNNVGRILKIVEPIDGYELNLLRKVGRPLLSNQQTARARKLHNGSTDCINRVASVAGAVYRHDCYLIKSRHWLKSHTPPLLVPGHSLRSQQPPARTSR